MTLSHRLLFAVFGRLAQLLITNCAVRVSCHEFVDTFHCKVLYEEKITYLIDGPVKVFFLAICHANEHWHMRTLECSCIDLLQPAVESMVLIRLIPASA